MMALVFTVVFTVVLSLAYFALAKFADYTFDKESSDQQSSFWSIVQ